LHTQLSPKTQATKEENPAEYIIPSLHDMVLQIVQEVDEEQSKPPAQVNTEPPFKETCYPWLTDDIRKRSKQITAIASDVDGTLLSSSHTLHPLTKEAIQKAWQAVCSPDCKLQWFFPATGKTRWGALNSLGPEIASIVSQCPGVFIQGLYCVNANNEVIFEKKLTAPSIAAVEKLVSQYNVSIVAYDGDSLYSTELTQDVVDLHEIWGEAMSEKLDSITAHENGIHKILIMNYDLEKLAEIRPQLEALALENSACVTQAVPSMLEFLPEGCSKALGVEKLCEALGIEDPSTQLLAFGDAENDVGMLKMAAIGVAVGNAGDLAKEAADVTLEETNDQGGAGIAIEVLGMNALHSII
jgi:Cof subfamily protein (haloacid dehalogenase superfamily)